MDLTHEERDAAITRCLEAQSAPQQFARRMRKQAKAQSCIRQALQDLHLRELPPSMPVPGATNWTSAAAAKAHLTGELARSGLPLKEYYHKEYLHSPHWRQLRRLRLDLDQNRCTRCTAYGPNVTMQVHHLAYRSLFNVGLADLRTLCEPCHEIAHGLAPRVLRAQTIAGHVPIPVTIIKPCITRFQTEKESRRAKAKRLRKQQFDRECAELMHRRTKGLPTPNVRIEIPTPFDFGANTEICGRY